MSDPKIRITPAAKSLAKRLGVDFSSVIGTGYKGRIHVDDIAGFNYIEKVHISPIAKKIAEAHNIDLKGIKGSGHHNKIMKSDILYLITDSAEKLKFARDDFDQQIINTSTKSQFNTETNNVNSGSISSSNSTNLEETEIVAVSMMRKVIAKRMLESYTQAPHVVQTWEVDMTEILSLRAKLLDPIKEKTNKKITITDIVSMAVIKTLMNHKQINARLSEDGSKIIYHNYVNLAMAVGLEEGLVVPVVKNADKKSLTELVIALKDITERTLSKKLTPEDQTGSTFTISNLGMYEVEEFTSIINSPNSAILSIARTKQTAVVKNAEIIIRPIMKITLAYDHRVIDGLIAAKFMTDLKNLLENPLSLLI